METALPEDDGSGSCPPCLPPVPPELQFAHEAANAGGGGSSTAASPNPQQLEDLVNCAVEREMTKRLNGTPQMHSQRLPPPDEVQQSV